MRPRREKHTVIVNTDISAFKLLKFLQRNVIFRSKLPSD